ncbi:DNA polymerase Y family protein [Microbacterium sp. SYP-A9085]|uniref:DNA polymerase Y family protein n=1 Tax=Microbacterium sp. SYP-A9085 TaxID=2664454 RepID=UPI00129A1406|nr:DNA polymerase Y family protein [Microbacterium sp. SYP-A9085]MRH29363.1 DNA polymerase Y family protein [Microbacterium sp. SYP-A9085]
MDAVRSLVLWFPDWPVTALLRETSTRQEAMPIAIVHANTVVACSDAARADGVRRGQRRRDAQARCPRLEVVPDDPARDQRVFSPVVAAVERHAPGVQIIRPGLCALRARGPARYHGGENAAACAILDALAEDEDLPGVRAGVADGPFTAERAARAARADDPVRVVPAGAAAAFLAPLPIAALEDPELAHLLSRLGVHTLGGFAALDPVRVQDRFGPRGRRLHALAAGADSQPVVPRTPPPELDREIPFEPPLEVVEQVAFGMRIVAGEFVSGLGAVDLVCTELRVELTGDRGERSERVWLHPGSFDAAAVVDRVRWQLAEDAQNRVLRSGVALVRLHPEAVDAASHHQPAIFGAGPDERVHHVLSRVQAMLGHRSVVTPVVGGGRWLAERQVLVPWGDRATATAARARPWPGSLPPPLPATVFPQPQPVDVTAAGGVCVEVDDRGDLSAAPAQLTESGRRRDIVSWAGPWTVDERGWDAARARRAHRFQVVDAEQSAWLLLCEDGRWSAEARYD